MPKAVLSGVKKKPAEVTAVCAMFDTGGSSGRLRKDYGIRAPGDLRRALLALANTSPVMEELFDFRFEMGELAGHNFANLLITALELNLNDYEKTIDELKKFLNVEHEVLPVTLEKSNLYARLENGRLVEGEGNIDCPKHNPKIGIERVFLDPSPKAYDKVLEKIKEADIVTIGPGDLYSTIAQVLLPEGISEALQQTKAKVFYLVNLMTKKGETDNFSVEDFVFKVEDWIGRKVDRALFNNNFPDKKRVEDYKKNHPELSSLVKPKRENGRFAGFDLVKDEGPIEHDSEKVAKTLFSYYEKN